MENVGQIAEQRLPSPLHLHVHLSNYYYPIVAYIISLNVFFIMHLVYKKFIVQVLVEKRSIFCFSIEVVNTNSIILYNGIFVGTIAKHFAKFQENLKDYQCNLKEPELDQ